MAAALARHGIFKTGPILTRKNVYVCCYATKAEKRIDYDKKKPPKIVTTAQSLAAKGFLRPQNEYIPPDDVEVQLNEIFQRCIGTSDLQKEIVGEKKYELLYACYKTFNHPVPNSLLHKMDNLQNVKQFYKTPVDVRVPYDKLKTMELPKNLHVQYEYHRFHPDTDTKFGGISAFPKTSTLVTGLKYKDKYKGHKASQQWPYLD